MNHGPLQDVRVLEIGTIGPGPFCGMVLAELGADVVRVDGPNRGMEYVSPNHDLLNRGKRSILVDLKRSDGVKTVLALAERADIMFEGFRPGVAERLGIGPEVCQERRLQLVYGRVTGWGQDGPLAHTAGHDINYIAPTGVLHAIGQRGGPPQIPLGLIGDACGGLYLALGLLAALHNARISGHGQVVDAAMVDGAAHVMTTFYGFLSNGAWKDERGANLLDGGAPFYGVYETSDKKYMAVGALEPQFFGEFVRLLGIQGPVNYMDKSCWPTLRKDVADAFAERTQLECISLFTNSNACATPVLSMSEAPNHPHLLARNTFVEIGGIVQPAPTPRFSGTPTALSRPPCTPGQHSDEIKVEWHN